MRAPLRSFRVFALVGALLGGCGDGGGSEGGGGGTGGATRHACGPDALCETGSLVCDINQGRCVECLAATDCMDDARTCIDGVCEERLCIEDDECPAGMPECTDTGCAPCSGVVATDGEEGDCFAARGPDGESPRKDKPDGCSAEQFVAALEDAGYDIPTDEAARQAIADDPVKRVTEGLCSVPFGNAGNAVSACELHDYCFAICGSSRAQCNLEFAARLLETCRGTYITGPCLTACNAMAVLYAGAVATASDESYINAQERNCVCCPDRSTDGTCDESVGESIYNSRDCRGNFPNGTSCLTNNDCGSGHCSVHGECAPPICVSNIDCPSNICNWGVCLARPLAEGSGCSTSNACESHVCTLGVCRECNSDDQCVASKHCNLLGDCIDDLGNNADLHSQRRVPLQHLLRRPVRRVHARQPMSQQRTLQPLRRLYRRPRQQRHLHSQRRVPLQHLLRRPVRRVHARQPMSQQRTLQPLRRLRRRPRPRQPLHRKR